MSLSPAEEKFIKRAIGNNTLEKLEEKLRPERASRAGFLGQEDFLVSTLLEDRATMKKVGVSYTELAKVIYYLTNGWYMKKMKVDQGNDFVYKKQLAVTVYRTMGPQRCPFDDVGLGWSMILVEKLETYDESQKIIKERKDKLKERKDDCSDVILEHLIKTKNNIILTELSPHLIYRHKFFEGKGTPYRMEPAVLIEWFKLGKASK